MAARERETCWVLAAGYSRRRVEQKLTAAYAAGLLSHDTYVERVDILLTARVIEPARLTQDLNFRSAAATGAARIREAVGHTVERALGWPRARPEPETVLALDWSGGLSEMSVGRSRGCDVVLAELGVSRRHARIHFRDGRWILQDLDSTNGTFVNGVRVGRCELRPGDHVSLGGKQLLID